MAQTKDDTPPLSSDCAFVIREILSEMAPSSPDEFDRLARLIHDDAETYEGGPDLAREVADELQRRANALRGVSR